MKHTSPTLLALAAILAVPSAYALDVKDDDVKMGLKLILQGRAEIAQAKTNADVDYAPVEGATGIKSDTVDFYMRRARLGFQGSFKDVYTFNFQIRADNHDKTSNGNGRGIVIYNANMGYKWGEKEDPIKHGLQFGLQEAHFNTAGNVHSSSSTLLANEASTANAALLVPRSVGIKYNITAPWVTGWIDIQNNNGDSDTKSGYATPTPTATQSVDGEGMWYSARIHISPEGEWKMSSPAESFAGKPGKGFLVGLDYGRNMDDQAGTAGTTGDTFNTTAWGVDAVFRMDGLSALAEYRTATRENDRPGQAERKSVAWRVQAGYAFPMGDAFLEPAVRYSKLDVDKDNDNEGSPFGTGDSGASGSQFEVGVNYYIQGNSNKFQFAYLNWKGEEGSTPTTNKEPTASIFRAQWQLSF